MTFFERLLLWTLGGAFAADVILGAVRIALRLAGGPSPWGGK